MAYCAIVKAFFLVFFISIGLCLAPAVLSADPPDSAGEASTVVIVKGQVKSISVPDQTLILTMEKKPNLQLSIEQQTAFVGFSELKSLQPKDRVRNIAVKIVKLPELGC